MSLNNSDNIDPKSVNQLEIYKKDQKAGILERTETAVRFVYDDTYFENNLTPDLSIHLHKGKKIYEIQGENVPPFFAGLLPEGKRFKTMIKSLKTSEDDLFTLLAALGNNTIGDVKTGIVIKKSEPKENRLAKINFYDYFFSYINEIVGSNTSDTSLAGVQEKISASMLIIPLNMAKKNQNYILKLNPRDKNSLVENEHAIMDLAKKCGLVVAKTKIIHDRDLNKGLLVERFDCDKNLRFHVEDGCQFLNKYPSEKYRLSLREVADAIFNYSKSSQVQILNLLKLYLFSYLIGNGDLHAKNISLIEKNNDLTLSPGYDILSTYPYGDFKMALKINGRDDNITPQDFINFGKMYQIPEKVTNKMINMMIKKLKRYYLNSFEKIPFSEKEKKLFLSCVKKRISQY